MSDVIICIRHTVNSLVTNVVIYDIIVLYFVGILYKFIVRTFVHYSSYGKDTNFPTLPDSVFEPLWVSEWKHIQNGGEDCWRHGRGVYPGMKTLFCPSPDLVPRVLRCSKYCHAQSRGVASSIWY